MRRVFATITLCLSFAAVSAPAQAEEAEVSVEDWNDTDASIQLAQAELNKDSTIFQHLELGLGDLRDLAERAQELLKGETVRMTLDECIARALEHNQDILIVSYGPRIAEAGVLSALGEFDPILSGSSSLQDSAQPASPQTVVFGGLTSIDERTAQYDISVGGKISYGTQYELSYGTTRTIGTFTGGISEYAVGTTLTLTQPLLGGRGKDANLARVRIARNDVTVSHHEAERVVETSVGEVIKTYWDLVGALENIRVRRESLANAERLVEINEQRLRIGTAAAIEVLQAKAGAASRVSDLITARTEVANAEDRLKQLIGMQDGELFSSNHIVPIERPQLRPIDWDLDRSVDVALNNRSEVRSAELQIESSEIERRRARNAVLPQLDIQGSYTRNDRDFDFSEALQGVPGADGNIWSIGVVGSIPIGNRAAKGNYRRSQLELRQNEQRMLKTRQDVMLDVRVALREGISSEVLVESTRQTRILQEANVAAEEKRLQMGVTTSQDLLDRQEDLTAAQVQEIIALVSFEKALVDLAVAEGTLLEELGIEADPDEPAS